MYIMYNVFVIIIQNNYFCSFYLSISVYFGTGFHFVVDLELYVYKVVLELRDPSASGVKDAHIPSLVVNISSLSKDVLE